MPATTSANLRAGVGERYRRPLLLGRGRHASCSLGICTAYILTRQRSEVLCSQVDVEDFPDIKSGYKITFTFKENPFFSNRQLVKELHYADDNALAIKGTDIEWTEEGVSIVSTVAWCSAVQLYHYCLTVTTCSLVHILSGSNSAHGFAH